MRRNTPVEQSQDHAAGRGVAGARRRSRTTTRRLLVSGFVAVASARTQDEDLADLDGEQPDEAAWDDEDRQSQQPYASPFSVLSVLCLRLFFVLHFSDSFSDSLNSLNSDSLRVSIFETWDIPRPLCVDSGGGGGSPLSVQNPSSAVSIVGGLGSTST
nr:hypothetical protein Iba_chr12dCG13550 [Ipomoea batatas]